MPTRHDDAPLIVTAKLDPSCFAVLDGLRRRHFPSSLNRVPAHISLFHHLPGEAIVSVVADAKEACHGYAGGLDLRSVTARSLGRGVAFAYESQDLAALHAKLARKWAAWLTPQDRQPFKPHVTIQNKVDPRVARALFDALKSEPPPECRVEGLAIWRYLGGPWEAVADIPFGSLSAGQ